MPAHEGLTNVWDVTTGVPFWVVVTVRADGHELAGVDFEFSTLRSQYPLLFELGRSYPGPLTVDLGDPAAGLFQIRFNGCAAPCEVREVLRVQYGDFGGVMGADIVVPVGPLPGPAMHPQVHTCDGQLLDAPMGGSNGTVTGSGAVSPDGALMINPTPVCTLHCGGSYVVLPDCDAVVSTEDPTMSVLKSRFVD